MVLLFSLCLVNGASALDNIKSMSQYVHDKWGTDEGFLGGKVHAIGESNDGYLWIGTERGLLRFDGTTFTLIQRPFENYFTGAISDLVSDGEGGLWIRASGPRLLRYHDGIFEDVSTKVPQNAYIFSAMASDESNGVLVSALGDGTYRYGDGKFETVVNAESLPGTVMSIARALDGSVWMSTREGGLYRARAGSVTNVSQALGGRKVNALLRAWDGGMWVGTDSGLLLLGSGGNLNGDCSVQTRHLPILALAEGEGGNIWIGTTLGLTEISPANTVAFDSVSKEEGSDVSAVYTDREGSVWYGGSQGIERLRDGAFTTYSKEAGIPHASIGPLYVDDNARTWFAPLSGGLYFLKDGRTTRVTAAGLAEDVVYSISGGSGEVWAGRQHGGLTELIVNEDAVTTRTFTRQNGLAQNTVYSVHRNRDGTIWAGTVSAGVSRLKDGHFTNFSMADGLSSNDVNSIVEGDDGTMWFGTSAGLDSFKDGRWAQWTMHDGLPGSDVESIFEDSKHTLWIVTPAGLAYLASGHLHGAGALPQSLREEIFGIAEDGLGSLWFATSDHVIQVNRDLLTSGSIDESDLQSYGARDGLRGVDSARRERSITSDELGQVWISLNSALAVTDPQKILRDGSRPITVRIRSMAIDGVDASLNALSNIAPGSRSISFTYAGMSLSALERVKFRYKLDGSDQSWSEPTSSRQVVYKNLGHGAYRFRVVASNGGLWNGAETSVPFVVDQAFWQAWWFQIPCLTALALLTFLFYRLRVYRLAHQLDLNFQERLAERTRIAQDLHDTLLQSFQGLMLRFQSVDNLLPARPFEAKAALDGALERADQAILEGRDAIQNIRSSKNRTSDLAQAINLMMMELREENSGSEAETLAFSLLVEGKPRAIHPLLSEELYRIGREALRNSIVHAHANRIETEITYGDSYLNLRFRDDGDGIDPETLSQGGRPGHWGIVGMKERSERIHAQFNIWSKTGVGTEIELKLPARLAYETQHQPRRWPFRRGSVTRQ